MCSSVADFACFPGVRERRKGKRRGGSGVDVKPDDDCSADHDGMDRHDHRAVAAANARSADVMWMSRDGDTTGTDWSKLMLALFA